MKRLKFLSLIALLIIGTTVSFGQGTTGVLTGTVTQDGTPLPGATVTVTSPVLQGTRTAITNDAGGYNFAGLPPGDYTVRIELSGLQTITRQVKVGLAQTARVDAEMRISAVAEAITVTASAPAVAETTEVQTNFEAETIEELPIGRTLTATTSLAPGVVSGVNGLQISGSVSYDNLYTVNGAVVQENLRGQPHNLFIEDAIQETTIQTAGVSAEYGNFTGGVVNAITKSGGNEFSGSIRDSLTNPAWTEDTPFRNPTTGARPPEPLDDIQHQYEATLGGRIIRDRLWFFLAGRYSDRQFESNFSNSELKFLRGDKDERLEAKLTGSITDRHTLVGSYLEAPRTRTNDCQLGCYDITAVDPSNELPNDFKTLQYNGILTDNFLVEARYSEKAFTFVGTGGEDRDRITGTPIRLVAPGFGTVTNEPYFCGICTDELRDNDQIALKSTYFLGTRSMGTHNIVAGLERFHETRQANNFQSPTNFVGFYRIAPPTRGPNGQTLVSLRPNDFLLYYPILQQSAGSDLNTNAFYINDKWDLNPNFSFNLGARYDANDSMDSAGNTVAKDSAISPRVGAIYDILGNGRIRINASYGSYVGRLAETVAGAGSAAGNPATIIYLYNGPAVNNVTPEESLRALFAWFDAQGGLQGATPFSQSIPGFSRRLAGELVSPNVDEWTLGAATQIGRGFVRADYIKREWQDFYGSRIDRSTGIVTSSTGARADLELVENTNDFVREYDAIQLQGQYRLFGRVSLGANYTYSELIGNVTGETSGGGPVSEGTSQSVRPEYNDFAQNNPVGFLGSDQTHKARIYGTVDIPTFLGNFNVGLIHNYDSGTPYSLVGSIDVRQNPHFYGTGQAGGVVNPGYVSAPTTVTYFFSDRGQFRFDDIQSTDVALNYSTTAGWLRGAQFFLQADMLNVFNNDDLLGHNTSVLTAFNDSTLKRFNPLAGDQPVEGVHYRKGPLFGKPTVASSYQDPRTYRVSGGFRF